MNYEDFYTWKCYFQEPESSQITVNGETQRWKRTACKNNNLINREPRKPLYQSVSSPVICLSLNNSDLFAIHTSAFAQNLMVVVCKAW